MLELFDRERNRVAIAENAHSVKEEQRVNSLWYLSFSLPFDDSKNEYCLPFNYVRLDGGQLYRIMPAETEITGTGSIQYQCEHVLATLIDNVLFGYYVVGNRGVYTRDCIKEPLIKSRLTAWHASRLHIFRQSAQLSFVNHEIDCTQSRHSDKQSDCAICVPDLISVSLTMC